jgi:hypothetical protein
MQGRTPNTGDEPGSGEADEEGEEDEEEEGSSEQDVEDEGGDGAMPGEGRYKLRDRDLVTIKKPPAPPGIGTGAGEVPRQAAQLPRWLTRLQLIFLLASCGMSKGCVSHLAQLHHALDCLGSQHACCQPARQEAPQAHPGSGSLARQAGAPQRHGAASCLWRRPQRCTPQRRRAA